MPDNSLDHETDEGNSNQSNQTSVTIDKTTLDLMVGALRQHESAQNIETEVLEDICIEAFSLGKMNDFSWLAQKLQQITGTDVSLDVQQNDAPSENQDTEQQLNPDQPLSGAEHLEKIQVSEPKQVEDPEHLKEILIAHEIWMNSVLNPREEISGGRANLRGANLQGYDLVGANLSCADFRDANLMGANLQGANLSNTWLQGANLQGANLIGCKLKRAKLEKTDLRDADLTDVDLEQVDMSKAILKNSDAKSKQTPQVEPENEDALTQEDIQSDSLDTKSSNDELIEMEATQRPSGDHTDSLS